MLQLGSLGSFALTGCGVNKEDAPFRESSPIPTPTPFDRPEPHLVTRPELTASLEEVVAENFAESLSVAVYDYSTHEQYVFNPGFIGLEASMVKVPIALTLMRRALANHRTLTGEERERVTASLGVSENRSTRSIFSRFGDTPAERAAQLNATYELLEINLTRAHEGWGGNNTCAHDQLCIAQAVYEGVPWVSQVDLEVLRNALEPRDQDTQGWGMGLLAFPEQKLFTPLMHLNLNEFFVRTAGFSTSVVFGTSTRRGYFSTPITSSPMRCSVVGSTILMPAKIFLIER